MLLKLGAVIAVILVIIGTIFFWKPWQKVHLPFTGSETKNEISIVKPKPDLGRARQLIIDPTKDSVMQIMTQENVRVTLEVPKGALKEKTTIKLIPFYHDKDSKAPTQGVIVSPANISFLQPVTLSFNFSESTVKNKAPKNIKSLNIRTSGTSQVMQIDSNAQSLSPTLVARGVETENYLPARILTGGAYVFSIDSGIQVDVARKAIATKNMNALTIIESANTILFNNQKLSNDELKKSKAAVIKILSQKNPPPLELFAASILQKKIKDNSFAFVREALAYDTGEGFFQAACKSNGLSLEQYMGYAQTAQLMGYETIAKSCLDTAKNMVTEKTNKVLADPNADVKVLMIALKDVQILGLDEDTNLDERLIEKAKEKGVEDAKKVADDPNSSPIDAAKQLQKLEALGVEEGPTYDKLSERVKNATEKYDEPTEDPHDVEPTVVEEEVLDNAIWSAIGIAMMQAMGFEELDEESVKKKLDEMAEGAKVLNEASYVMCTELGGEDCESRYAEANQKISEAEIDGYRAAENLGQVQSREYEEPEYLDENGEYSLYFEPTPSPGTEDNYSNAEIGDDGNYETETVEYDYGLESSSEDDSSEQSNQEYESYDSSSDYAESAEE